MPHETQKAFTISSWIINGISCLENDIATQRLHRGGYLSHTNLTLTKSTCYARTGGCVESLNSPHLCKSSHLRGGNISSPRRETLVSAERNTHLRGEKRISPHATGQCPESSTQYSRHLLRQSRNGRNKKYGDNIDVYLHPLRFTSFRSSPCPGDSAVGFTEPLGRWPKAAALAKGCRQQP